MIGHTLSLKLRRRPRDVGLITSPPQRCLPSTQRTLWTLCKDATRHGPAEWPEGDGGAHATIELASLVSIATICGTDHEGRGMWSCEDWNALVSHLPAPRGTQVEDLPARRSDGSEFIIPAGGEVIAVDISGAFRNCLIYLDPGSGLVACTTCARREIIIDEPVRIRLNRNFRYLVLEYHTAALPHATWEAAMALVNAH